MLYEWTQGWGGGLLVSLPTKSPKLFSVLSSQLVPTEKFFCFWRHHVWFFSPPQKPHLQLFQDIQQKNQAVEKSHQIGFFMCDPCVCLWLLSAENLAGQGKSLHPLLSGSSASCRHTAAVSHQPQGHRVRGGNRTVDIFICICVCFFFYVVTSFYHLNMLSVPESVTPEEVWTLPSRFKLYFCFSIKMKQPQSSQIHPHLKLASSNFQEWSVQRWSETRMLKRVPTNSQQSWMVLFRFVPKTQQSICSIDKTLFRSVKNRFELFLELKEVCSVAQCR